MIFFLGESDKKKKKRKIPDPRSPAHPGSPINTCLHVARAAARRASQLVKRWMVRSSGEQAEQLDVDADELVGDD